MTILLSILVGICGLGMLACFIMTLIKMFKHESTGLAVLGIFCGIWAFIWGWMNAKKHDHKQIMMIWTALFVAYLIFYGILVAVLASSAAVQV